MNPFDLMLIPTLIMLGGIAIMATLVNRFTLNFQFKVYSAAVVLRLLLSIAIYPFGLVQVLGDEDSGGWWGGVLLQDQWTLHQTPLYKVPLEMLHSFTGHHQGYQYLVGFLLSFTSAPNRLVVASLNCVIGALTVVVVYRIASQLYSPWVAKWVAWLSCFAPSLAVWSAQTLKEPIVIFLESLVLYGCVVLKIRGSSGRHLLLCVTAAVLLIPFRFYAAYISLMVVVVTLAIPEFRKRRTRFTMMALIVIAALGAIYASGTLITAEAQFDKFDLRYAQTFRSAIATGGSGVTSSFNIQTPTGFVLGMVVGFAHLMLAPFPWQLGGASLRMLMTLPELIGWWWFFFWGVVPGLKRIKSEFSNLLPLLLMLGMMAALYSVLFGNVGLAYRQRAQLLPWLFVIGMRGLEFKKQQKVQQQHATRLQILARRLRREVAYEVTPQK
jgi:hypothetical protein